MAIPTTQKECTTRRIAALIIGLWDKIKNAFLLKTSRGAANGVASLDANGKVPSSQLPTVPTGNLPSNSSSSAGIVASGSGQAIKAWMTDSNGNPAWRSPYFLTSYNGNYNYTTWVAKREDNSPFACRPGLCLTEIDLGSITVGKWVDINVSDGASLSNGGVTLYISTNSSNNPACYVVEASAFAWGLSRTTVRGDLFNGYSGNIGSFYSRVVSGKLHVFFNVNGTCNVKIASDGDIDKNKITMSDEAPGATTDNFPARGMSSNVQRYFINKPYAYGQGGSSSVPVYVTSSGEVKPCSNIPVIEHVTSIPVNPTVGTIYAL